MIAESNRIKLLGCKPNRASLQVSGRMLQVGGFEFILVGYSVQVGGLNLHIAGLSFEVCFS